MRFSPFSPKLFLAGALAAPVLAAIVVAHPGKTGPDGCHFSKATREVHCHGKGGKLSELSGKVVGVSDGDTVDILIAGRAVRIRLFGIDCPEKRQPFGAAAKKFTSSLVFGREVTVRVHDTDRYGRTVGEVVLSDGRSLNRELVQAGLAWWYRRYAPDEPELEKLEAEARAARKGLWGDKVPIKPWEFRALGRKSGV